MPREVLVDAVVHEFVHKVVEAVNAGVPNVHPRALPHGRQALEHLDVTRTIVSGGPLRVSLRETGKKQPLMCLTQSWGIALNLVE